MHAIVQAGFVAHGAGPLASRFHLWTAPSESINTLVVYVHPFAEEMNKSRRMVAWQARVLAEQGHAVLQPDLLGCGDSAGDSGDATWDAWVDDVVGACTMGLARVRQRNPDARPPTLWLWGLRSGCLLAAEAAQRLDVACHFLFWQPAVNGQTVLKQFLRLDRIGSALGKPGLAVRESATEILADGRTASVAGYDISPGLATGMSAARLRPPDRPGRLVWLDVASQADFSPSPATRQVQGEWQRAGFQVEPGWVLGPPFWQTTEIEDAPELIGATRSAIESPTQAVAEGLNAALSGCAA